MRSKFSHPRQPQPAPAAWPSSPRHPWAWLVANRALRADSALARLPVIAIIASVPDQDRETALAAGVDHFVNKPDDSGHLVELLSSCRRT